ncbi:mating-type switching protein Swi10 [Aspergillus heteromorphus CBS 117.55]|uniref:Mating-type switching protein Swi10 n=1 Tax=Aspergillus heteromorphus CBS 117.55 TaxID=1448321 RepID=A0A317WIJ4_9EURO|nr:mating-type switching protein Swi10 [Aspergillus heteromorphus CBS 117.55]PWY86294.1 mating-type switching protein Swi10 [Aspergillus heteromorphus CBS 117.55]
MAEESGVGSSSNSIATPGASGPSTPQPPSKVQQPKPQALPNRSGPSAILVSTRQKGNPILNHIKLLPWEYADIPADYVIGNTTCALFLSLKYHRLHPEYIYSRIRLVSGKYLLRIVLIIVDIPNHEDSLKELSKTSVINNLTLILCWSAPEAAHYLELFKSSENSQPTAIRTQQAQSYKESLVEFVTTPRSINKSDTASLLSTFGSLQNAINAQPDQISAVPGWGEKKVKQWCGTLAGAQGIVSAADRSRELTPPETYEKDDEDPISAEAENRRLDLSSQAVEDPRPQELGQEEQLSEGIMAALAKYRENGS